MIGMDELKAIFNDKLTRTGSLDAAFTKSHWVAFKKGYEIGYKAYEQDRMGAVQDESTVQDRWHPESLGSGRSDGS